MRLSSLAYCRSPIANGTRVLFQLLLGLHLHCEQRLCGENGVAVLQRRGPSVLRLSEHVVEQRRLSGSIWVRLPPVMRAYD